MNATSTYARLIDGFDAAYRRIELDEGGPVRRPVLSAPSFHGVPYRPISPAQSILLDVVDVLDVVCAR